MRAEFAAIAAGFALLPQTLTANKAVVINSSGNGMTVTTGSLVLTGDLTLAGAFTTMGAFNTTLIQTASVSLTLPGINDTLVGRTTTDTLTNKTLTAPVMTAPVMTAPVLGTPASGTLTNCTGLPNAGLVNSSITIGSTNIALGATATTVAGLTLTTATFNASLNTLTNITTAMFATNVVDTDPTLAANSATRLPAQSAVKSYVDNAITGLTWKPAVQAATVTTLPTYVYANGSSGVGATITEVANGALPTIDGVALTAGQRILVKNETAGNAPYNGLYSVTQVGSVILPFILTRVTDADTSTELWGSAVLSEAGTVNANTQWTNSNATAPTIGTTAITFSQISGAGTYTATGGITLTGNQFSLTNSTITLGSTAMSLGSTYGTIAGAITFSGALTLSSALTYGGVTLTNAVTGTGSMVLATAPTLTTPVLGAATGTSLALGGAAVGSNSLAVTGTTALSGLLTAAGGVSSTLTTDATSSTTGSIITAGGISTQKALYVGTGAYIPNLPGKNRIINGNMAIDQRNAGASVTQDTSGTQYTLDRWAVYGTVASKFTIQQNAGSITPPAGFSNYIGCTSSSAYAVASTDTFIIQQVIEGFNTADLNWGTANAKPITFSAWVYSSLTGTFGGVINNSAFNYSYPFSYSIPVANTWTYITITIAGPTSGTWIGATNGIGMRAEFSLGSGSSVSGTAGAWTASGLRSATGAVSVVGTSGATFYFTGVQLEVGTIATPYEFTQYPTQLAQCQRYYEVFVNTGQPSGTWACYNTNQSGGLMYWFKVTKRANPSVSIQGLGWYYQFGPGPGVGACDVIWNTPTVTSVSIGGGNSNGLIAMYATQAYPAYGYVTISAEL